MRKVGLVFLSLSGFGHLISTVEMAKRLLEHQDYRTGKNIFSITVLIMPPKLTHTTVSYIQSVSSGLDIRFEELPPMDIPSHEIDGPEEYISLVVQSQKPHVKGVVSRCLASMPVAALVIDLFATTMINVANELGATAYIYFTSSAAWLGLMLYLPTLHEKILSEFEEVEGEIQVPGISAVPPLSMPSPVMNKMSKCYTWFLYHSRRFQEARGIIVNTFAELEPAPLEAILEGRCSPTQSKFRVHPVGPLLSFGKFNETEREGQQQHQCIKWLDGQPPASVVYLCFGSMGCFDAPQVKEMALGLEHSGHRFLWCLRSPPRGGLWLPADANLDEVLPDGFLERTRGRGLVWPTWAPQTDILSHGAVGGFVTHCGWNSTLESLWCGVPMLVWPLFAEQHFNALLQMVRNMGVAFGIAVDRKHEGFVGAEELERGIRCLMGDSEESNRVRARAEEMKLAGGKAMGEGGSSSVSFARLIDGLVRQSSYTS